MDFYVALVVFIGFLGYIGFQLLQTVPAVSQDVKDESIRMETYQLAELLISDGGQPNDWHDAVKYPAVSDIGRIGLSDSVKNKTNHLSPLKISRMKTICAASFDDIKMLLDLKYDASFSIIEHKLGGDETYICGPATAAKKTSFAVSRTVFIDGTEYPTEFIAEVWRS